jgi:hypothetical protein
LNLAFLIIIQTSVGIAKSIGSILLLQLECSLGIRESKRNLNVAKQRYMLVQDMDCHWFVIPVELEDEWLEWVESDDAMSDAPKGAIEVGGAPQCVTFTDPQGM